MDRNNLIIIIFLKQVFDEIFYSEGIIYIIM